MIISLDLPSGLGQLSPAAVTEQWEQGFGELAIFRGANNHCRVSALYKTASGFALGSWVNKQRTGFNKNQLTPERIQRLGDLGFVWDAHAEQWEQGFSELTIFKDEHSHCRVSLRYKTADGFTLGTWVSRQRVGFNKDQLTPERIQRLGDLGFVWDAHAEKWGQGFSELTIFKDSNNHCRVPLGYKTASGFALGRWVNDQRKAYNKDQLTPERIQRVGDLGFLWDPLTEQWEQGFRKLAVFKDEHSHCRVPATYKTLSGFKLGSWVSNQRKRTGQTTPERIQRLDDLGFVWDFLAERWEQGFSELAIFRDTNNHCLVLRGYKTASGFALGRWVNNQRTGFNKDQLTPERIQRLDKLGFVWDAYAERWEQGFSELAIFRDANNHCRVPLGYKTASGFTLGDWVSNQRKRKDQLTSERIQRLEALRFIWDPLTEQWEQGFSELTSFKDSNNHCRVPLGYKAADGFTLGTWVSRQRVGFNKDQLTPERIQRLGDLGFLWDPLTEQWEQGFRKLAIYEDTNSHCLVPATYKTLSGFKLGSWVRSQRSNKDQATPERIQRLDKLGFVWGAHAEQWEQGFSELAIFRDTNNHCFVLRGYKTADGFTLGDWVRSQRKRKDQLTPERIQRLDELGFVWRAR